MSDENVEQQQHGNVATIANSTAKKSFHSYFLKK